MASDKQASANRRNATKSTGPKTQSGKLRSRANSTRHGLTATTVVTAIENTEEFKLFEAAIKADYQPVSTVEHELVARLVSLLWRLRRAATIETNLFQLQGRIVKDQKLREQVAPDKANPGMQLFYQLLRGPDSVPSLQADISTANPDNHKSEFPIAQEHSLPDPNPATIFLRLCNLSSFPIERVNRYETALWRQAAQTLFILDACRKRLPSI